MKRSLLLSTVMLGCLNGFAQQPENAFDIRPVVQPGMTIAGLTFNIGISLGATAINDMGEIAFAAYCDGPKIFTSRRIVAMSGEEVDGKFIDLLSVDDPIAINNNGEVAFYAWYSDTKQIAGNEDPSNLGLFVDHRLAIPAVPWPYPDHFTLADDGTLSLQYEKSQPSKPESLLSMLPTNRHGQMVIPVNLGRGRFVILLASPVKH